ncbi:MAG: hypothetical protein IT464_12720 [Planctomycetes bacterium]|nr:hypothetical protein [Planctomycetota bacterium]
MADFAISPTQYYLGDNYAMWYCNFSYPLLRRGVKPVAVTLYQPGESFDELTALKDAGETRLTVWEADRNGSSRTTESKGLLIDDVVYQHDGIDGCMVVLTDIRSLIDTDPFYYDVNLVDKGGIVRGFGPAGSTDPNNPERMTLTAASKLFSGRPFAGRLAPDFFAPFNAAIPMLDGHLTGGTRSDMIQKLLETLALDLVLGLDGLWYVSDRNESPTAGIDQLAALDMEWANREPDFTRLQKPFLRARKYRVPCFQDHTLQVFYGDPATERPGTVTPDAIGKASGMALAQAYPALGDYWDMRGLLLAAGLTWSAADEDLIRRYYRRKYMRGTAISSHGVTDETERAGRVMTGKAVQAGERKIFVLVADPALPDSEPLGGGPGAWLNIELGRLRPGGEIVPTRPQGMWSLVLEQPEIRRGADGRVRVVVGRVFRSNSFVENGKIVADEDPYLADLGASLGTDEAARAPLSKRYKFNTHRFSFGNDVPLSVEWQQRQAGVIRLKQDTAELQNLGEAVMGVPASVATNDFLLGEYFGITSFYTTPADKAVMEDLLRQAGVTASKFSEDIAWRLPFTFCVFVTARQNTPNDERKFWFIEVPGFDDAPVDVITLLPDDRLPLRRTWADRTGRNEYHRPEADGFGKPLNLQEVRAHASRRVSYIRKLATEPEPVNARFYNIKACEQLKLTGRLDQVILHVAGPVVECELQTGARARDEARRYEAEMQKARAIVEFAGKTVAR